MSPPHIPKIGATTVPPAASPRAGGQGAGLHKRQAGTSAAPQAPPVAEAAVVVNRSLELLETMAGRVSEATGESMDVSRSTQSADGDSSYRVQLMSFIVGSLSRASQAFRQQAAQAQEQPEPEEAEEAVAEEPVVEEVEVEAALPEQPMAEPVQAASEPEQVVGGADPEPAQQAAGYGSKGQAVQGPAQDGSVKRWA